MENIKNIKLAKVVACSNEKGGVGKSTVSTTLAYLLAKKGEKVLLLDMDGQANATLISGVDNPNKLTKTIATLMNNIIDEQPLPEPDTYILHMKNNIDLIPANSDLFALERNLMSADFREGILVQLVDRLRPLYDRIIIDCLPSMGAPLLNVLMCADSVIIPTQSELLSAYGLTELMRHIRKIQVLRGNALKIDGILINMDSVNTNTSKEITDYLSSVHGKAVNIFQTRIPRSIKVAEASIHQQTICEYDPTNPAALAYEKFVEELLKDEE